MFNPYIIVPFVVWAIAQFLKFIIAAARGRVDFKYLYASGGMPSVHAAVVTSLAVTGFLVAGPRSPIFGLTIILAAIVIYDSFGVRRSAGEQAVAINMILDAMEHDHLDHPHLRLREILGHKPLEVSVGGLLGFILGCLFNYSHLGGFTAAATTPVTLPYTYILAALSGLILVLSIVGRLYYLRKYRKVTVVARVTRLSSWVGITYALVGGILAALQYEKLAPMLWAVWPILFIVALIATKLSLIIRFRKAVPAALVAYRSERQKEKWLQGPNKKKRAKAARSKKRS